MNSFENFKKGFLTDLAKPGMGDERHYQHWQLARNYGISDAHARELLIQWAAERLIAIRCYDGEHLRSWHEWEDVDDMFFNATDSGHIRVKLLAAGAALVEDLPARPIGFATV
jgi:hypothetical protein